MTFLDIKLDRDTLLPFIRSTLQVVPTNPLRRYNGDCSKLEKLNLTCSIKVTRPTSPLSSGPEGVSADLVSHPAVCLCLLSVWWKLKLVAVIIGSIPRWAGRDRSGTRRESITLLRSSLPARRDALTRELLWFFLNNRNLPVRDPEPCTCRNTMQELIQIQQLSNSWWGRKEGWRIGFILHISFRIRPKYTKSPRIE